MSCARLTALVKQMPRPDASGVWSEYASGGGVDSLAEQIAEQAEELEAQADEFLAETAVLEDPQLPTLASLCAQEAGGTLIGADGQAQTLGTDLPRLFPILQSVGCGLVSQGDIRGPDADRARGPLPGCRPRIGVAPPMGARGALFDQAVFAACELELRRGRGRCARRARPPRGARRRGHRRRLDTAARRRHRRLEAGSQTAARAARHRLQPRQQQPALRAGRRPRRARRAQRRHPSAGGRRALPKRPADPGAGATETAIPLLEHRLLRRGFELMLLARGPPARG